MASATPDASPKTGPSPWTLTLFLGTGLTAIAFAAILIRLASAPSLSIAFWRIAFSLLLVLPLGLTAEGLNQLRSLDRGDRWRLLAAGICLGVHFWAWIASLAYTSVAASVLLVTTNPIWVGLAAPWLLGERATRRMWAGILVATAGAAFVALDADVAGGAQPLLGNGLALLGGVAASGYLICGRAVRPRLHLWTYASATLLVALGVLFAGMVSTATPFLGFESVDWVLFLGLAVGPQIIGHNALSWSLRYIRADTVASLLLTEPIGAAVLAWLFLAEPPGLSLIWGGAVLLLGVVVVVREQGRMDTCEPLPSSE